MSHDPLTHPPDDALPDDVPTLQAMVRDLRAALAVLPELQAAVAALQEEVRRLREQQNRNSGNSSRPPSSDLPWHQRPRKPPTGKKPGGQKGHPGQCRRLEPPDKVDHVVVVTPSACGHCGTEFPAGLPRRRKFRRWQVAELPPIRPEITEYQLHARRCAQCHRRTWAELPPEVGRRCVGPRVQALAALLTGACRLSRRQCQALLQDLCGLRLALGTLVALEADTARALARPYQELAEAVAQAPVLGVDETSWREGGTLHWLWTAVTPRFAFYRLDRHRSRAAFEALLGAVPDEKPPPAPVLITDRYSAYGHLPDARRSFCWAHLAREFRAAWERGGVDGAVGRWALDVLGAVLEPWQQYRRGALTRDQLLTAVRGQQEKLRFPLRWGAEDGTRPTRALCNYLLERSGPGWK